MPIAKVQLPDGRVARFEVPEGWTPEQIQTEISRQIGDPSQGDKLSGLMRGMRDPIDAGAQLLPKALESVTSLGGMAPNRVSQFFGSEAERVNAMNDAEEKKYQAGRLAAGREGFDAMRLTGNVASPANLAMASRIPQAVTTGGKVAAGSAAGAGFGALSPVYGEGDFWGEKGKQVALGAVGGAAIPAVGGAVSRVISPQTGEKARTLMNEGVRLTPGQILGGSAQRFEDKLTSIPLVGDAITSAKKRAVEDFNRAAFNRALKPIGESAKDIPVGPEGVGKVRNLLGKAYDEVLAKVRFQKDAAFDSELAKITQMVRSGLPEAQQKQFDLAVKSQLVDHMTPAGTMSGESLKRAVSQLRKKAKGYKSSMDQDVRDVGDALGSVVESLHNNLKRINPMHRKRLADIDEGFANYAKIRQAASTLGDKAEGFTPAQLNSAVRSADTSAGKGRFASGEAKMQDLSGAGVATLTPKVSNSGTVDRLLAAGAVGYGASVNPWLVAGLGMGMLPYSRAGRAMTEALLARRPQAAKGLAKGVRDSAIFLAPAASPTVSGLLD